MIVHKRSLNNPHLRDVVRNLNKHFEGDVGLPAPPWSNAHGLLHLLEHHFPAKTPPN